MMVSASSRMEALAVKGCEFWRIPTFGDSRGNLTVTELDAMPFPVRRVFFITEVPVGEKRAGHAQRTGRELLLAIRGSLVVTVDDGTRKQEILLQHPEVGLVLAPMTWCVVSQFSQGAVLAVFASNAYDKNDQVCNYDDFLSTIAKYQRASSLR